jgi:monoamine oxidase
MLDHGAAGIPIATHSAGKKEEGIKMGRTPLFRRMLETLLISRSKRPAAEAVGVATERREVARRDVLRAGGVAIAAAAVPACAGGTDDAPVGTSKQPLRAINASIGVVGAGISGLACAYQLKKSGCAATVYEANTRLGGRIFSDNGAKWLGQTIERGGELIDTPHKTMIGFAQELGLTLENVLKPTRETFYRFNGQMVPESVIVEEFRALVDAMRDDLRNTNWPTADYFTEADRALDNTSLAEWLDQRGAPANVKALLNVAYAIEYGVETSALSAISFIYFAKASKQSKLRLWGNWSDERYHVVGGNQQIPLGIAARLAGPIWLDRKLTRVRKLSDGRIELTFLQGRTTITAKHDAVVLALPYHLLRGVDLDASLGLPDWKKASIQNFVCGDNAKLMVGFNGQPWIDHGGNGAAYSDLPYLQTTWETSPSTANATRAVLTDYTGATLARSLSPSRVQTDCERFLNDYEKVIPGTKSRARRDASGYVCHLEHWPSNPFSKGAYSANQPGYFTTIEGLPSKPVGNLYFGSEQTDSFYSWQGFMEGAALAGLRTAAEILADFG